MKRAVKTRESGYALLFIFLTMAVIGILFYAAMPRVAFEAQRDQEQLLIDRGEQYKRAIQVYFRKFKKYPAKIEDLENTSGQRFLRQRYKDPMTGKDEWRPIHVVNGVFTDSLTQKNKKKQDPASVNNFITELKAMGDGSAPVNSAVSVGTRQRPGQSAEGAESMAPALPADPNSEPEPTESPDANALPQLPSNFQPNPPAPGLPAALTMGRLDSNGNPINPTNGFTNGVPNQPNLPGMPGRPGQSPSGPDMIRNILTSPRPGGPPPGIFTGNQGGVNQQPGQNQAINNDLNSLGQPNSIATPNPGGAAPGFPQPSSATNVLGNNGIAGNAQPGANFNNSLVGGGAGGSGIAGFASKAERSGIKIYNEKSKYNEWEFIYDFAKDKSMGGGQMNLPNQPGLNPSAPGTPAQPAAPVTPNPASVNPPPPPPASPSGL